MNHDSTKQNMNSWIVVLTICQLYFSKNIVQIETKLWIAQCHWLVLWLPHLVIQSFCIFLCMRVLLLADINPALSFNLFTIPRHDISFNPSYIMLILSQRKATENEQQTTQSLILCLIFLLWAAEVHLLIHNILKYSCDF